MVDSYIVLLICLLFAVERQTALAADDELISKSQQQFATVLLQQIAADSGYTKDIFISPYSVYSALLTVYVASAGKTEKSLEAFLLFDNSSKPDKDYITKKFFHEVSTGKQYELTSVDRIYASPDYKLKSDKKKEFGDKAAVFKTINEREDEINNWVSKNTKGLIKQLVPKGGVSNGPALVFVNAAYFKGLWTHPLLGGTSYKPFTLSNGTVIQTIFMSNGEVPFQSLIDQELKVQVISLPYKGDDISMMVFLPTTKPQKGAPPPIADVVRKLPVAKFKEIQSTLGKQKFCSTDLLIPKFKSEGNYELLKTFEALGGKQLFTDAFNLTNLFEPGDPLFVKQIIHKAKVNVYENGTEAAAASEFGLCGATGSEICPTKFHADHPFIYVIYDKTNHFILYVGILNTPKHK